MKKIFTQTVIVLLSFLNIPVNLKAQSLSLLNSDLQKVRVGLVDEFFDRFNGKTAHPDIPITDSNSRNNLMALLDLTQFTSKNDSLFQKALEMMDVVINNSVKLNYSDTTWVAIAHCKGLLERKSVNFDLYLTVQRRKEDLYKWVIAKVEGNKFNIKPRNENEKIMLSPGDHETNFMSLGRMTKEQPFNVKNFMARGFEYDMTSVFTYLVYSRKLKIDYVNELEFVFTQVPGYIFHIKYFERENKNSGWLISNFYKATQEEKAAFLSSLYPQNVTAFGINNTIDMGENVLVENKADTIIVEKNVDHKAMFTKRRTEKISQLLHYINLLQGKDTLRSQSVYQSKTEALFADNAKVYLQHKKKWRNRVVDISAFCSMLINGRIGYERIDSICIPVWNDKINS